MTYGGNMKKITIVDVIRLILTCFMIYVISVRVDWSVGGFAALVFIRFEVEDYFKRIKKL